MDDSVVALTAALAGAPTFDAAAAATARIMLDRAAEALERSPFGERGQVLRAMVHLRPDDGYRRLAVIEHDTDPRAQAGAAPPSCVPSATAWRWMAAHRCAISIDAELGRVQPHAPGVAAQLQKRPQDGEPFASKETRERLLGRRVTHLVAVPLRLPGGVVAGMISIEADCRAAIGKDPLWSPCGAALQAFADIAAPYLAALPHAPPTASLTDPLLPVVGPSMAATIEMLRVFAQQEETILLSGPTGAGKSRLARWCKEQSPRRNGPFEVLDLMTVPEDVQMAELFGWRRGAFTGAVKDNPGCVARADGGTLFIDEIDKLSLRAQAGLLHLLEERTYRPLGEGAGERSADVRFVVGTNANLHGAVRVGRFREDLYYRVNVLPLKIPPLQERADEIPLWAAYMLERRHRESSPGGEAHLDPAAARALARSPWPGNLRQLDNIVRRAYSLALLAQGGAARALVLREAEVLRALDYEQPGGAGSAADALLEAARQFVIEAERRAGGERLDLELLEALRGMALALAEERLGSREEAFRLFGREALVAGRNHHKTLRRELEKVAALYRALGEEERMPFRALLEA